MPKSYSPKYTEQDGGYYFEDYDIHIVAKSPEQAMESIKETHGIDVTIDPNAGIDPELMLEKIDQTSIESDE
jgi:hypothetical protein